MPLVISAAIWEILTQLSRWEWLGLAVSAFILNTLFLKWFLAWSQSDASDEEKDSVVGNVQLAGQKGAPALAAAIGGGGGGSSNRNVPAMPGRPRRRKHLSEASSPGVTSAPSVDTSPSVTEEAPKPEKAKPELEPAAVLTGPSLLAPSVGIPFSKRVPAESKPAVPDEPKMPLVERSAEPPVRPTRRAPIPAIGLPPAEKPVVVEEVAAPTAAAASAATSAPADEAKEKPAEVSVPESVPVPMIEPAPVREELPAAVTAAVAETTSSQAADEAIAAIGRASFGKHAPPTSTEEATNVPESELATPTVTSSLSLRVDPATPIDTAPVAAAPIEVAAVASEPPEADSGVSSAADHLAAPAAAGASSALASTASGSQEAAAEAAAPEESLSAMTSDPSELSKTIETKTTHSSADFAPASAVGHETQENVASGSTPPAGGRPVIARRAVGPARIFLTREFSSLRIKSNLNPPKTPNLAAAHAKELAAKVTPVIPPVSSGHATETPPPDETAKPDTDVIAATEPTPPAPVETTPESAPTPPAASEPDAPVETAAALAETTPAEAPTPAPEAEAVATPEPELPPATPTAETPVATTETESHAPPADSSEKETAEPAETPTAVTAEATVEPEVPAAVPVPPLPEEPVHAPTLEVPPIAPGPESEAQENAEPVDIAASPAMLPPVSTTDETSATSLVAAPAASAEPALSLSTTRPVTPPMTTASTSNGERATAQLTFSFEVASLQLTPFFKLGSVQLRPLSNVVSMQLAHGENAGTNPLSANIAFEILTAATGGGNHGPVQALVLKPLSEARAAATPQPKLAVNAVQLTHGAEAGPIQITPAQTSATSVQVLATFAIAGIDFTPLFEVGSMRLEPTSSQVLLKVSSGSGQASSLDHLPPSFELTDVQVTPEGQISGFTLVPRAS